MLSTLDDTTRIIHYFNKEPEIDDITTEGIPDKSKIVIGLSCPSQSISKEPRSLVTLPVKSGIKAPGSYRNLNRWSNILFLIPSKNPSIPFAWKFKKGLPPPGLAGSYSFDFNLSGSPAFFKSAASGFLFSLKVCRSKSSSSNHNCFKLNGMGLSEVIAAILGLFYKC